MLTNAVIAGGIGRGLSGRAGPAAQPAVADRRRARSRRWPLMLGVAYGVNLAVVFYALIVLRQMLAVEVLSPGWVSVRAAGLAVRDGRQRRRGG